MKSEVGNDNLDCDSSHLGFFTYACNKVIASKQANGFTGLTHHEKHELKEQREHQKKAEKEAIEKEKDALDKEKDKIDDQH